MYGGEQGGREDCDSHVRMIPSKLLATAGSGEKGAKERGKRM